MGDHWKSLANKLGAPGMDAPSIEPPTEAPVRPGPTPPRVPPRPAAERPAPRSHDTAPALAQVEQAPAPIAPAPMASAARPEKVPKRKSSWDTLTSFFGIAPSQEADEPIAADVSSAAPAETDALSGPVNAPVSRGRSAQQRSPRAPSTSKPTALDELFGDAPRQDLSWEKPSPRRMVDDVSAWDDEPAKPSIPETVDDGDDFVQREQVDSADDGEQPTRRRRRRRRGSSRRDSTDGPPAAGARSDVSQPTRPPRGPRDDAPIDEVEEWADAELVEPVESADDWSEPETFESQAVEADSDVLPQRRSSRRRRRGGRNRGERTEGSVQEPTEALGDVRPPREPRPAREPRDTRDRDPNEVREPREVREAREPREAGERPATSGERSGRREPRPPREGREAREGRGPREPREVREPREPRQRPPRPVADASRRELSIVGEDNLDDEVDSSLAAELEDEGGPNRHPKIPTWADSLESIISANMDNHKRSEGQRGGPPRGRPRSSGPGPSAGPRR